MFGSLQWLSINACVFPGQAAHIQRDLANRAEADAEDLMRASLLEKQDEEPGSTEKVSKKSVGLERVRVVGLVGVMVQKAMEQKEDYKKQVATAIERCTTLFATANNSDLEEPKNELNGSLKAAVAQIDSYTAELESVQAKLKDAPTVMDVAGFKKHADHGKAQLSAKGCRVKIFVSDLATFKKVDGQS